MRTHYDEQRREKVYKVKEVLRMVWSKLFTIIFFLTEKLEFAQKLELKILQDSI